MKWNVSAGTVTFGFSSVNVNRVSAPSVSSISMPVMVPSAVTVNVSRVMRFSWSSAGR